jgi:hypothetical protein
MFTNWTYEQHKHYSSEHMQKAEKQRQAEATLRETENHDRRTRILRAKPEKLS